MNNKIKTNKLKISLIILAIISIISIAFFCAQIKVNASFVSGIPTRNNKYTTGSLAYAIEHDKQGFVNEPVENLFNISNIVSSGYNNIADIRYNTATCLYHRQSTITGATLEIVNVIDINKSGYGKIDIYGKGNSHVQINDNSDGIATQMAYLIYKANGTQSGISTNEGQLKSTIYNVWHNWGFKNLIESSGLLDSDFYRNSTANTFGASNYNQAEKNIAAILAATSGTSGAASANKVDAESYRPGVSYQGSSTYIGPLKMTYSGAATAVTVEGKSASWARKKADGTFEIGTGNVPNNGEFYAVINEIISASNINVKVTVTNAEFKARIVLLKNPAASGQQLIYFASEGGQDSKVVEWTTETPPPPPPPPTGEGNATISGYVWQDVPAGKENEFNNIYDSSENKISGVTVELLDGNGNVIRTTTTVNGEYTFGDLDYDQVDSYSVRIYYNGYDYAAVQKVDTAKNGSKGSENVNERRKLNSQYNPISSEVTSGNFNNSITSRTDNMSAYKGMNSESSQRTEIEIIQGIEFEKIIKSIKYTDINFGIRLREMPNMQLSNDIDSVIVTVNNYQYRYDYGTRTYTNTSGINIGVRYQNKYTPELYQRAIYASDIQAAVDGKAKVSVEVIYKVKVQNSSTTLQMDIGSIANYYDANYNRIVGWADTRDKILTLQGINSLSPTETGTVLNRCDIDINVTLGSQETRDVAYIRYEVSQDFVYSLLNGEKEPLRNITEITSYQTRYGISSYGLNTYRAPGDTCSAGELYAAIDVNSSPNNAQVDINSILCATDPVNNCKMEDDTEVAPGFKLQATTERALSGTVFEDSDADKMIGQGQERLGNGILNENENVVKGVTVRLVELDENGNIAKDANGEYKVATYSNGEQVITKTDEHGNYKFGYYDENTKKYVGILPGQYKIQYIYENGNQILDKSGNLVREITDVNEYKSTIVTSGVIKNAIANQAIEYNGQTYSSDKWYVISENNRYSDAIDDMTQRNAGMPNVVNNATINNNIYTKTTAEAFTANINIGVEHTSADTQVAAWYDNTGKLVHQEFINNYTNIDFGIIEKPKNSIETSKEITYMILKTEKDETLVEGNPSDINAKLQYVRSGLDGIVPVEIDTDLLHGATLELEYTITVKNTSEVDYDSQAYYYYGIKEGQIKTITVNNIVDYMDSEMVFDEEKNSEDWELVTLDQLRASGYISEEVYNTMKPNESQFVVSKLKQKPVEQNKLANIKIGSDNAKSVKLYASKLLASKDEITIENFAEVSEIAGSRPFENAVPGNYNPTTSPASPNESDDDTVKLIIMPPTGNNINIVTYVITSIVGLSILIVGIILIRKKIINKNV